jgi:restriction system protein
MAVWVVRAGGNGDQETTALDNNLVTIHWNELPDLSGVESRDEVEALYRMANPDDNNAQVGGGVGMVCAFRFNINKGDLVILPLQAGSRTAFAIGEVTGPYAYRTDLDEEVVHTLPVKWLSTDLLRTSLNQDLLARLGIPRTVYQINVENAEERFRAVLRGESDGPKKSSGEDTEGEDTEDVTELPDTEQTSRDEILKFIQGKFSRHDLARLVDAVLKAEGYMTRLSPQGPDGGVDILAGSGPIGFAQPRLCVQVKSSASTVDVTVLRNLQGILKNFGAEQGLLVSWGGFTTAVHQEASRSFFSIRLWDSGDLLEAIFNNYDKLPSQLRTELPLKRIWALVSEE